MYNNKRLKKLAEIAVQNDKIPEDISEYVLQYLSKKELKEFLYFYKAALEKKRVHVFSSVELSKEELLKLKEVYKGKDILTVIDNTLGGGLKIRENDMTIDFTFKNYINETIEKLKD
jgi:F0F1-type ATP synthase delta subunit